MSRLQDLIEGLRDPRAPLLHVATDTGAPDGRTDAPVVVMIHGIASSSATFSFVIPLLEKTHRVIAVDLLGFGGSPRPANAEYTLDEHVSAIAATIRHLRLDRPFVLVGHSLGALIGSRYAATHAEHLSKLVLVSPPIYLAPDEIGDRHTRQQMSGYLEALRYLRANQKFTMASAALVGRLLPIPHVMEITDDSWLPFIKSMEHCLESQTVISDLARVDQPVEVIYGRFDEFLVPGNLTIIEKMRNVTTHVVNGSDHMIRKAMARVVATAVDA
ncbi:alpha/beta hydrolase [Microbacteriaceae bacterium VKM Ac-2855]|nr:alpha/beta hydrolase [Microbacteriaceae bacterium VKM Ac-2855]